MAKCKALTGSAMKGLNMFSLRSLNEFVTTISIRDHSNHRANSSK